MPKPTQVVWLVERKYHRQGRGWELDYDQTAYRNEHVAKVAAREAEGRTCNVGWQFRVARFVREQEQ